MKPVVQTAAISTPNLHGRARAFFLPAGEGGSPPGRPARGTKQQPVDAVQAGCFHARFLHVWALQADALGRAS